MVKETDSKSVGESLAGSNPVVVAYLFGLRARRNHGHRNNNNKNLLLNGGVEFEPFSEVCRIFFVLFHTNLV